MESFGEVCDRIVRTVLAEQGPTVDQERTPPASKVHLPLSQSLPPIAPGADTRDCAENGPCQRFPGELCLEMCGDFLQAEVPDTPLDVRSFEALRASKENPLHLCELALSSEPGRRPPLPPKSMRAQPGTEVGAYLAGMTQIEASNVGSFEDLANELGALGAPADLIDRVRVAQSEERVHVVLLARMAAKHGATASASGRRRRPRPRSLAAFACRNAADGCGSDAYNALALAWAAHTARDLSMRSLARHLAADRARHADLAHDVYTWAAEQLPPHKVARLREIRATAIRNASREAPPSLVQIKLGAPSPAVADRLAELLIDVLATD